MITGLIPLDAFAAGRGGVVEQQRSLSEVVQQQSREHHHEPDQPDRFDPEVTHIGIERFAAGDAEEHRAEHQETGQTIGDEEVDGVTR